MHRPPRLRMTPDYSRQQNFDRAEERRVSEPYVAIEQHEKPDWAKDFVEGEPTKIGDKWYLFIGYDRRGWVLLAPIPEFVAKQ